MPSQFQVGHAEYLRDEAERDAREFAPSPRRDFHRPLLKVRLHLSLPLVHIRSELRVGLCICLDTYMPVRVYKESGICLRNHCGAEPPRDLEPPGLVTTVGGRDRASASYAAADRVKAPARAARGRFRGIHGGRTAPSLPAEAGTISGGGYVAGSVPPVLVRSPGCSRTPPRPHGSINANEKEDKRRRRGPSRERNKGETK